MATIWKGVGVTMQSAIEEAIDITSISNESQGVATSAGHGLSNGDIVYLTIIGMGILNGAAVRVANVTADTFVLEGVNTTSLGTFTSGTAQKVTLGTSITTAADVTASGGEFDMIDTTTIHDTQKKQQPGLPSATSFAMTHLWNPTDEGQAELKVASDSQGIRVFKFQFGTGGKILLFAGYVGYSGLPGGSAQDKVTTPSTVTIDGMATYYAS